MGNTIVELMATPVGQKDIDWLKSSLQAALELELSTLPPYLCGLWSITDKTHPARKLMRTVVLEEMLHMSLACNMLTTIGGTPEVVDGFRSIVYPGPLPGGVRPELTVYLAGLSKLYIQQVYLQIEYPENGPIRLALALEETFPTIGNFYDKVLETFQRLKPTLSGERQLTYNDSTVDLPAIKTLDDVSRAVTQIKQQGEGTSQSPVVPGSMDNELAHYYKFAEVLFERKLVEVNGKWEFVGDPIPFPPTYPVAPIPRGGYANPPDIVAKALQEFNQLFADMLAKLQSAWSNGHQGDLDAAIGMMFALSAAATAIMQIRLPDSSGVYGPDFRLRS